MKRFIFAVIIFFACCAAPAQDYGKYYTDLPIALTPPEAPVIPDYSVCLTDFGGVPDGVTRRPFRH